MRLTLAAAVLLACVLANGALGYDACYKDAQPRGKPTLPDRQSHACSAETEKDHGLCYPKCPKGYTGLGGVCWEQCTPPMPASSLMFCCTDKDACSELVRDISTTLPNALIKFALDLATNAQDIRRILTELEDIIQDVLEISLPKCKRVDDVVTLLLAA